AALSTLTTPALARIASPVTAIGGPAFGTRWRATLRTSANSEALRSALDGTLRNIDLLMSPWRRDSVITAFNASSSQEWQPVDGEIATVVRAARAVRDASDGAFDPCVGPLVGRWGFGPIAAGPV